MNNVTAAEFVEMVKDYQDMHAVSFEEAYQKTIDHIEVFGTIYNG